MKNNVAFQQVVAYYRRYGKEFISTEASLRKMLLDNGCIVSNSNNTCIHRLYVNHETYQCIKFKKAKFDELLKGGEKMDPETIRKFQVIGAAGKMQTISLENEIKLMDGIPYSLDFFQDFSDVYLDGIPIKSIPVENLFVYSILEDMPELDDDSYHIPYDEKCRFTQSLFKQADKYMRKEQKLAKKWKKGKKKRKKAAERLFDQIDSGEYFVKR